MNNKSTEEFSFKSEEDEDSCECSTPRANNKYQKNYISSSSSSSNSIPSVSSESLHPILSQAGIISKNKIDNSMTAPYSFMPPYTSPKTATLAVVDNHYKPHETEETKEKFNDSDSDHYFQENDFFATSVSDKNETPRDLNRQKIDAFNPFDTRSSMLLSGKDLAKNLSKNYQKDNDEMKENSMTLKIPYNHKQVGSDDVRDSGLTLSDLGIDSVSFPSMREWSSIDTNSRPTQHQQCKVVDETRKPFLSSLFSGRRRTQEKDLSKSTSSQTSSTSISYSNSDNNVNNDSAYFGDNRNEENEKNTCYRIFQIVWIPVLVLLSLTIFLSIHIHRRNFTTFAGAPLDERGQFILKTLSTVTNENKLKDDTTPQHRAALWMIQSSSGVPLLQGNEVDSDPENISFQESIPRMQPTKLLSTSKVDWIIQRYVLVALYFSTTTGTHKSTSRFYEQYFHQQELLKKYRDSSSSNQYQTSEPATPQKMKMSKFPVNSGKNELFQKGSHSPTMMISSWKHCGYEEDIVDKRYQHEASVCGSTRRGNYFHFLSYTDVCQWYGISCDLDGRVESIDLSNNCLRGSIPNELSYLSSLTKINLERNTISGSIPSQFGNLSKLVSINLSHNTLYGSIPKEFGELTRLREIDLSSNKLSSSIPSEVFLPSLKNVNLGVNQLTGSLPESIFQTARDLEDINLSSNQLTGSIPHYFTDGAFSLSSIRLNNNKFTGQFPRFPQTNLHQLKLLDVEMNNLGGTIPASFFAATTNLEYFNVGANQLTGSISPDWFEYWGIELKHMVLWSNQMTGVIPIQLSQLNNLKTLHLSDNLFSGRVPHKLCNLRTPIGQLSDLSVDCGATSKVQCDCCTYCYTSES